MCTPRTMPLYFLVGMIGLWLLDFWEEPEGEPTVEEVRDAIAQMRERHDADDYEVGIAILKCQCYIAERSLTP